MCVCVCEWERTRQIRINISRKNEERRKLNADTPNEIVIRRKSNTNNILLREFCTEKATVQSIFVYCPGHCIVKRARLTVIERKRGSKQPSSEHKNFRYKQSIFKIHYWYGMAWYAIRCFNVNQSVVLICKLLSIAAKSKAKRKSFHWTE